MENLIDEIDKDLSQNTSLTLIINEDEKFLELDLLKALD